MHILGIANGSLNGNSEILLKAALTGASKYDPSITSSWLHSPSVQVPRNPAPLQGAQDVSAGTNAVMRSAQPNADTDLDDRAAVLNAILDADALIISTPIYSHQPAGMLKALVDRILGPFVDAALAKKTIEGRESGDPRFQGKEIDSRLLKPRVVGFMAVGGSTMSDQITMALPTLHNLVYSLHAKVVDQVVFQGYGAPGSVLVTGTEDAPARAQQLGRHVASQLGKTFDEAEYLGPVPEGACPFCHLAKIDLFCTRDNAVGCVTCGAEGKLEVGEDGVIRPVWNENSSISSITMAGKERHIEDVMRTGKQEMQRLQSDSALLRKQEYWRGVRIPVVALPSNRNFSQRL
ncbi:flavo protein [Aspergillus steynii IBT 23096]|uniref:Flavo protein n=1 Tax=Aspergillus steynii IBT 23096 TaxID=1392250 RepID=A0A2I2FVV5_9EURO|nr:flavo protein [Aspergillus steynii IBT 23096]PLB44761.1 flavo protein [Aspergillus steynii IBT 23096]